MAHDQVQNPIGFYLAYQQTPGSQSRNPAFVSLREEGFSPRGQAASAGMGWGLSCTETTLLVPGEPMVTP